MRIAGLLLLAGASLPRLPAAGAAAPAAAVAAHPFAAHVTSASLRFGIPETWIWRVMHVESRGNSRAVSHAGAMGLMQIMPGTWKMLTARHRLGSDPFDPRANILAGAAYLRAMWDRYGDVSLMLAAYNAGPGRADAYVAGRRGLPAETVAYVAQIAPTLSAQAVGKLAAPPPPGAPDWRAAPVFAVQPQRRAAASGPPARTLAVDANAVAATPSPPSPVSLFVPLSGRGQ